MTARRPTIHLVVAQSAAPVNASLAHPDPAPADHSIGLLNTTAKPHVARVDAQNLSRESCSLLDSSPARLVDENSRRKVQNVREDSPAVSRTRVGAHHRRHFAVLKGRRSCGHNARSSLGRVFAHDDIAHSVGSLPPESGLDRIIGSRIARWEVPSTGCL